MIKCIFQDRIEKIGSHIVRVVNARWKENRRTGRKEGDMDVFRQYDDGREEVRNICVSMLGGYYLYDTEPEEWVEPWIKLNALVEDPYAEYSNYKIFSYLSKSEYETIVETYPAFRWFLDKIKANNSPAQVTKVLQHLKAWKIWPECERLYNGGYFKLSLSKPFAQASYMEQCAIAAYLKTNPEIKDPGLGEIRTLMKNGLTQQEYALIKRNHIGAEEFSYIKAQARKANAVNNGLSIEELHGLYKDYKKMALECGHDFKDPYWRFPSDLRKAHDKVMTEKAHIEAAKLLKRNEKYMAAVKKFMGKVVKAGDLEVFVPETVTEISEQATKLHQCLVTADYIGKVIDRRCILVFIKKEGKPLATAELNRKGNRVQFYGDEKARDLKLMKPSKAAEEALNQWIKEFRPRISRAKKEAA